MSVLSRIWPGYWVVGPLNSLRGLHSNLPKNWLQGLKQRREFLRWGAIFCPSWQVKAIGLPSNTPIALCMRFKALCTIVFMAGAAFARERWRDLRPHHRQAIGGNKQDTKDKAVLGCHSTSQQMALFMEYFVIEAKRMCVGFCPAVMQLLAGWETAHSNLDEHMTHCSRCMRSVDLLTAQAWRWGPSWGQEPWAQGKLAFWRFCNGHWRRSGIVVILSEFLQSFLIFRACDNHAGKETYSVANHDSSSISINWP